MAGGSLYLDRFVINGITVYVVESDPNGSLSADIGSVAFRKDAGNANLEYRNTDGGTTWVQAGGGNTDSSVLGVLSFSALTDITLPGPTSVDGTIV